MATQTRNYFSHNFALVHVNVNDEVYVCVFCSFHLWFALTMWNIFCIIVAKTCVWPLGIISHCFIAATSMLLQFDWLSHIKTELRITTTTLIQCVNLCISSPHTRQKSQNQQFVLVDADSCKCLAYVHRNKIRSPLGTCVNNIQLDFKGIFQKKIYPQRNISILLKTFY